MKPCDMLTLWVLLLDAPASVFPFSGSQVTISFDFFKLKSVFTDTRGHNTLGPVVLMLGILAIAFPDSLALSIGFHYLQIESRVEDGGHVIDRELIFSELSH